MHWIIRNSEIRYILSSGTCIFSLTNYSRISKWYMCWIYLTRIVNEAHNEPIMLFTNIMHSFWFYMLFFFQDGTITDCMNVDMRTRHVNIMGISYKGKVSKTMSGLTCQQWSSQSPHKHSLGKTEHSNYCRNVPEFEKGPWCYTSSSSKRWDLCDVPMCSKSIILKLSCGHIKRCNLFG